MMASASARQPTNTNRLTHTHTAKSEFQIQSDIITILAMQKVIRKTSSCLVFTSFLIFNMFFYSMCFERQIEGKKNKAKFIDRGFFVLFHEQQRCRDDDRHFNQRSDWLALPWNIHQYHFPAGSSLARLDEIESIGGPLLFFKLPCFFHAAGYWIDFWNDGG